MSGVPSMCQWQRDKIKMLPKDQRPRWMEQEITDTTEDSYSVFRRLDERY